MKEESTEKGRVKCAQEGKGARRKDKEGEKGRWMIGYPSHPRPRSTNIRVGGIYSYKLSGAASARGRRRAQRGICLH